MKIKVAVFCSGSGSNAEKIFEYFNNHSEIEIALMISNKKDAYALERAKKFNIPSLVINKEAYQKGELLISLKEYDISWIVLAGFLWLIPQYLVSKFPNRIINIHPALLPKYGGKGMYGHFVHEAVVKNKDTESGMSIHFVNDHYDEGEIIFQAKCAITAEDNAEEVAKKVLKVEHQYYAPTIEKTILESK
ncbi:MAG: phosphoribosylglycinamide formyltransferase [Cytophagales bacterium]|nr:MAG: phosphoribosylglycinamide formyltransferase [Cytophagales bacterium]